MPILLLLLAAMMLALPASFVSAQPTASSAGVTARQPELLTVAQHGIAGRFYGAPGKETGAAVLMIGGSDCGYPSAKAARDLAESGYSVLALAYCSGISGKVEGLPDGIANIPIEYVDRGFKWLSSRVGRKRPIAMMGESRGAELALLYGSMRGDVRAVIAFSPSSLVWPAVNDATATVPAWTWRGRAIPHVTLPFEIAPLPQPFLQALADPVQVKNASIAVEAIRGPVLLISSHSDGVWPAAKMADRVAARLHQAHFRYPLENLTFDKASHLLMGPGPGLVEIRQGTFSFNFGGTPEGTLAARDAGWAAAKRLLSSLPAQAAR